MLELRTLGPDDWQLWRELRLRALAEAPQAFGSTLAEWQGPGDREERWRARLSIPGARDVVVLLDGDPVGMASGVPTQSPETVELISMWVSPGARGRGVGDQLIRAVERWAAERGTSTLRLSVMPDNDHAVSLYERHGFLDTGEPGDLCPDGVSRERVLAKPLAGAPHAPALEMLWEADDPRAVLASRFGFASVTAAFDWVRSAVRAVWGISITSCEKLVLSDRNALAWVSTATEPLLVKWSVSPARFRRLTQVARLTRWLDSRGVPVSAPVPALDGPVQVEVDGASVGVQRVVRGRLLDVAEIEQVYAAGAALADLHDALTAYPEADLVVPPEDGPEPLAARITGWLESAGEAVPEEVRQILGALLAAMPTDPLPVQLVHGDVRSANVLCCGVEITAVLDLEEVKRDHCVEELARSAVLLGTRFRDWGPVSPEVRSTFVAGYESVRVLTPLEKTWFDVLELWCSWALVPAGDDPTGWRSSALSLLDRTRRR